LNPGANLFYVKCTNSQGVPNLADYPVLLNVLQ